MEDLDLACEDAQRINVWLAKAAREGRAAKATVSIAVASMLVVLDALERTAEAEKQTAAGCALN